MLLGMKREQLAKVGPVRMPALEPKSALDKDQRLKQITQLTDELRQLVLLNHNVTFKKLAENRVLARYETFLRAKTDEERIVAQAEGVVWQDILGSCERAGETIAQLEAEAQKLGV